MKKVVLFLALILALIYCPVNAAKRMTSIEPVGEIPFTIGDDGRIYVTAFVNGSDSLIFLVDTGATTITLNTNSTKLKGLIHEKDTVDNMGTTGFNKVTESNDNSLTIGTIQYDKAECVNIPFSKICGTVCSDLTDLVRSTSKSTTTSIRYTAIPKTVRWC